MATGGRRSILARLRATAVEWGTGTPWERVRASGLFDTGWYVAAYPDVAGSGLDPLAHFATIGSPGGRRPNPLFDPAWYRVTYPDVARAGVDPLVHYLDHGAAEGRDPGPGFATRWYLSRHGDVRAAAVNPLAHYLTAGQHEGRRPVPLPGGRATRAAGAGAVAGANGDGDGAGGGVGLSVVVVSGEPGTPGHRYRVSRLAEAVGWLGGRATVLTVPEAASLWLAEVDRADVVVLWRTVWGGEIDRVVRRARQAGAVVVFDVDDLMIDPDFAALDVIDGIRSQGLTEGEVQDWYSRMRHTARAADACIATTPVLATHLRALGAVTHLVPNGFDDDTLVRSRVAVRVRRRTLDDGTCRIGYAAGSRTHQRDFALIARPVAALLRDRPSARLVAYRHAFDIDEFPAFDGLHDRVEWRDVVPHESLPAELARFDVNLAPLEVGNPFCEAKSDLKFFEAALVDVPTVASPTALYRAAITDGVDGFLCATPDEWRAVLDRLVRDPALRQATGQAARQTVLWGHGPARRAQVVAAVFDQLVDGGPAAAAAFALERARAALAPQPPAVAPTVTVVERDRLRASWVTVVVPVHDYAHVVTEALDSAHAQTLEDLDLVVVDDASTDDSRAVARSWLAEHAGRFNRAVLVAHETNAGLACARNAGFAAADTPYVLPLDADNALLPECCERLLAAASDRGAAFAYPRIRHVGGGSELFPDGHVRGYLPWAPQRLVPGNYVDAMALVRADAWAAAGGYRTGLAGWEDYDLWCRFAELGLHGVQVDDELALYRVHDRSMLHTVTHRGDRLADVRAAITAEHPWLDLEERGPRRPAAAGAVGGTAATVAALRPRRVSAAAIPAGGGESTPRAPAPADGRLSERARSLLPLLRCPVTGETVIEAAGGELRTVDTGRRWPVVAGRPVLVAERGDRSDRARGAHRPNGVDGADGADGAGRAGLATGVAVLPGHRGNPLPERARELIAQVAGRVLHLSGGGTAAGADHVIEVDADVYDPTDVVADAHRLPFDHNLFDLVVAMNAFEHYRDPAAVVAQIGRVLRPGGMVFVHTAFLQPVHEAPHHYFNCTRHGLEQWFGRFETVDLRVSDNFQPAFSLSWLASEAEAALAGDVSPVAADAFRRTTLGTFADFWRDAGTRVDDQRWAALGQLAAASQERLAAGFEYLGRLPDQ
jgi:GT2 family glycosyltransferase/glycosyltransferase involved in cell wall biosynthesis/SAM-dependent methyltransferase